MVKKYWRFVVKSEMTLCVDCDLFAFIVEQSEKDINGRAFDTENTVTGK